MDATYETRGVSERKHVEVIPWVLRQVLTNQQELSAGREAR